MNTHSDITEALEAPAPKRDKGFTLVELLIVIVILGVLSTVTVFAVSGITTRGRQASCEADKRTVAVAVESYYAEQEAYPADMAALVTGGYLREASDYYSVGANGSISPIGTKCT